MKGSPRLQIAQGEKQFLQALPPACPASQEEFEHRADLAALVLQGRTDAPTNLSEHMPRLLGSAELSLAWSTSVGLQVFASLAVTEGDVLALHAAQLQRY